MELLNKVKSELEKKGYDFSSEFWTDEELTVLYDVVYATEKVLSGQECTETPQPTKSPTTYRECLEALPDGYRELALKNAEEQKWRKRNPDSYCKNVCDAVSLCIVWNQTPQKYIFWDAVYDHYKIGIPATLPELPNNE